MGVLRLLLLACSLLMTPAWSMQFDYRGLDLNGLPCHIKQGYGPFDYTKRAMLHRDLSIVEEHHFTSQVEQLVAGESAFLLDDIDYTLRAWPNHHRALFALIRYMTEPGRFKPGTKFKTPPPECYLDRAERFQPKDSKVPLLYGLYLHRIKRYEDAEKQYRKAIELNPKYTEAYYNLGVLLADEERFDEAVAMARKAYRLGYPLSGLKRRLAQAGHPIEP